VLGFIGLGLSYRLTCHEDRPDPRMSLGRIDIVWLFAWCMSWLLVDVISAVIVCLFLLFLTFGLLQFAVNNDDYIRS